MRNGRHTRLHAAIVGVALAVALAATVPAAAGRAGSLGATTSTAAAPGTVTGGTSGGPASNPLCAPATLQTARTQVEQELSNRATQLGTLSTRISNTPDIPAGEASTLNGIISAEQTGITDGGIDGLESLVQSATTCAQVVKDAYIMVIDFRVYALVSPQVDLAAVASTESSIATQAVAMEPTTQAAITTAGQAGKNVSEAQQSFSALEAKVSAAQNVLEQVSMATLIAQVPSDYPGDATALVGDYTDVTATGADLRSAEEDLNDIASDLS